MNQKTFVLLCAFAAFAVLATACGAPAIPVPEPPPTSVPTLPSVDEEPLPLPAYQIGNTIFMTTGEWAPFTSETMEGNGFFTEIVTAVFQEMGREPEYIFYPWVRAEEAVASGESWAAFPYSYNDERAQTYTFSDNVAYSTTVFFYYKPHMEAVEWEQLEDLQPYLVGTVTGYYHEALFADAGLNTDSSPDEESGIRKLQAGRIDLFPMSDLVGWALIRELFPDEVDNFGVLERPLDQTEICMMVLTSDPQALQLLDEFNVALQAIKDNGTYEEILTRYNLTIQP